jgi:phosphocarrier protein
MKEFQAIVAAKVGLHARPAAIFATLAKSSGATVRLAKVSNGEVSPMVDGASVLRVMTLGVRCGDEVLVSVEGASEEEIADQLKAIIEADAP